MKSRIQTSLVILTLITGPAAFAAPQGAAESPSDQPETVTPAAPASPVVAPADSEPEADAPMDPSPVQVVEPEDAAPAVSVTETPAPAPTLPRSPAVDAPRTPAIRLSVAASGIRATDASADWVSDEEFLPRGEFGVGVVLKEGLTLQVDYAAGRTSSYILANYDAELTWHQVGVRARYRLDLLPIVNPYVTAGGGLTVGRARIYGGAGELRDNAVAAYGDVAAGIEARSRGRVVFGGFQDFGYSFRTAYDFDEATTEGDDGASAEGEVDLGQVRMSGFQIRLGVFVEFPF